MIRIALLLFFYAWYRVESTQHRPLEGCYIHRLSNRKKITQRIRFLRGTRIVWFRRNSEESESNLLQPIG